MMVDSKFKKGLGRGLSSLLGDSSKTVRSNKLPIKAKMVNRREL